jgi:hypothetical protein
MSNRYNAVADLEYRSEQLAAYLFILGFKEESFNDVTIDDCVNAIRDKYRYDHDVDIDSPVKDYIKRQNISLTRNVRRAWFDVQVATYEVEHGTK